MLTGRSEYRLIYRLTPPKKSILCTLESSFLLSFKLETPALSSNLHIWRSKGSYSIHKVAI